ncbi:MAG: CD1871A family CXXC motif-containing protein [Bacillota bacterium]|nr:CD1871A family CXXC motif-containing protein [Bacillota bacterium]
MRENRAAAAAILAALAFLLIGVGRGEAAVVLRKAVTICMECIGLG